MRVQNLAFSSSPVVFQAVAGSTYQVAVDSDLMGEVSLTIHGPTAAEPAQFQSIQPLEGGAMRMEFAGTPWRRHTLETSTNLLDWLWLTNLPSMLNPPVIVDPAAGDFPVRFYRLRSE